MLDILNIFALIVVALTACRLMFNAERLLIEVAALTARLDEMHLPALRVVSSRAAIP